MLCSHGTVLSHLPAQLVKQTDASRPCLGLQKPRVWYAMSGCQMILGAVLLQHIGHHSSSFHVMFVRSRLQPTACAGAVMKPLCIAGAAAISIPGHAATSMCNCFVW